MRKLLLISFIAISFSLSAQHHMFPLVSQGETADLATGLISVWPFDDTGSTAVDVFGSNDGTVSGALVNQTGILNKSFYYDGSNDYVSTSTFSNDIYTISIWIKPASTITKTTGHTVLIDYRSSLTTQQRISLGSASGYAVDETFMINSGASGNYDRTFVKEDISTGWNHFVITWNSTAGRYDIYKNAVLQIVYAGTYGHCGILDATQLSIFGKRSDSQYYYNGHLDQVLIYNVSFEQAQVTRLYNNGDGIPYINF